MRARRDAGGRPPRPGRGRALAVALAVANMPVSAQMQGPWRLMSRHGECAPVDVLARRMPELAGIDGPHALAARMREQGHAVVVSETPGSRGRLIEVAVPAKSLALVFATDEHCRSTSNR